MQLSNVHSYQRPDADHLELDPQADALRGHAGRVTFNKIAGERTRMTSIVQYKSPGFELNDIGFLLRADEIWQQNWLQIKWERPRKYVRTTHINFNQWSNHNFDGDRLSLGTNFNGHWTFQNLWSTGFGVNANARNFDDRRTRGGPGGYGNRNVNSWQYFNTNNRLKVSFNWNSNFGSSGEGGGGFNVQPGIVLRPTSAFSAEIAFLYDRNTNDAQWVQAVVASDATHYVFGRLNQTTTSITTRVNYTLTPNLSLQVYAQPFVAAGAYRDFKQASMTRARDYEDRFAEYDGGQLRRQDDVYLVDENRDGAPDYGFGVPDFDFRELRSTVVLRYQYRPGSTMFFIWSHGRA
ncbi:MAG: DUF5916 domain-containing protein, partial [Vicinamibacterales bacterium]